MSLDLATDFGDLIARRIREAHREIAARWFARLKDLLPVEAQEVFPAEDILDHIPALITEIADHVGGPDAGGIAANTTVFAKARELGELRFQQRATVHQLLREYRILGGVLGTFVSEEFESIDSTVSPTDVAEIMNRLHQAVFVLLETTVDTFVSRYTARIEDQTARLEGFNRMVSHELRQPMSAIQSAIALLDGDACQDDDARRHVLDTAQRNVFRLGHLTRMLGTLASSEQSLQVQTTDISKITGEVVRQLEDMAASKSVTLRSDVGSIEMRIDTARLELALLNLVSNGIKYSDPSKPDRFVELTAAGIENGCQIRVHDNGVGVGDQDRERIFERYYRAQKTGGETDGIGLGLPIARESVSAMGGTLDIEAVDEGTTFVITLHSLDDD